MTDKSSTNEKVTIPHDVQVTTTEIGPNKFNIVATAIFESEASKVWVLLCDWEQFLHVGLPGLTSKFIWMSGGPNEAPSKFHFEMADVTIKEEIYEMTRDEESYRLCYKTLEPALGIVDYDAILELYPTSKNNTAFSAAREVTFAPGSGPEMLADMVKSETQCLKDYFRTDMKSSIY